MAVSQSSTSYKIPPERGSIYDRTGTVVLATSVSRDRLAAHPVLLTPQRRAEVATRLVELFGLTGDAATNLTARMTSDREYVVLARDLDPAMSDQIRQLSAGAKPELEGLVLEPEQVRLYPQPGGGPHTIAGRPPARLREPRRRRAVRRRAVLPGPACRHAHTRRRPAGRGRQPRPGHLDRAAAGISRPEPDADHRRLAPGSGGAGAPVRLDRGPRQARLGRRDGPVHGRGARVRQLPVVRRQRLPGDRRDEPGPLRGPTGLDRLRARLGVEDADRDGGARCRDRHARHQDPGHRDAGAGPWPGEGERRRPQGDGHDAVRGRHRVFAQRRRRQGVDHARQDHGPGRGPPGRHVALARPRLADRDRRGQRGQRPGSRSRGEPVAPDRPCERVVRSGRGSDPGTAAPVVLGDAQRRLPGPAARRGFDRQPGHRADRPRPRDVRRSCPRR